LVRHPARWEAEGNDLDPGRPRGGRALLVEEIAADAVGVADQHVRPATRAAKRAFGDLEVVAHDVELRDARLGEVDLARVRDRDLASADVQHDVLGLARHASTRVPSRRAWPRAGRASLPWRRCAPPAAARA